MINAYRDFVICEHGKNVKIYKKKFIGVLGCNDVMRLQTGTIPSDLNFAVFTVFMIH